MNTLIQRQTSGLNRPKFIEILNDEFINRQGYGIFTFLTVPEIEALYNHIINNDIPAKLNIMLFVRSFMDARLH